jgi:hypothetical protein
VDLNIHTTDDQLEHYALGRLPDSAVPVLEEHLMVCAACQERLDQIEAFALGMRQALQETPSINTAPRRRRAFWFLPVAAAFAAIIMSIAMFYAGGRAKLIPAASLQLTALRGDMQFVPPSKELDLTLTDVPSGGGPFRVEVVDASGTPQWNSLASGTSVKVQRQLKPGDYFVRLYGPGNQVLHEYGFRIRS